MSLNASDLSDTELKSRLKEAGIEFGPINDSTRHLYINLWKRKENDFKKPPKKPVCKKPSPPESTPNLVHKKSPSLKRSSSDTRQEDSLTNVKRSSKRLKRWDSETSSGLVEISFSNGACQEPPPKRPAERANRYNANHYVHVFRCALHTILLYSYVTQASGPRVQ